ncbi:MAG: folylpolyglutamate synthase/dihydrofolate synthase family protein [Bacteroidales bacterium]
MTYQETIDFLFARLPMYQRQGAAAYKSDLATTRSLDTFFEHPHKFYRNIHIAGTNGKGSVSHMLASILQEAGYKTGLYTSPHYRDFRERIRINGAMIPKETVVYFTSRYFDRVEHFSPSFFELSFAMASWYFKREKVDVAIWETGMGGRLDSTNVVTPEVAVITNISLDHTRFLGNTPESIAKEKAGIIKKNVPVVIGEKQKGPHAVFKKIASERQALLYTASENIDFAGSRFLPDGLEVELAGNNALGGLLTLPLMAGFQLKNLKTVLQTVEVLQGKGFEIEHDTIKTGFGNLIENTGYKGRFQVLQKDPLVIADSGHNPAAVKTVIAQISKMAQGQMHFVLGMVNDKDIDTLLAIMPKGAAYYFAKADISRGLSAESLRKSAEKAGLKGKSWPDVKEALRQAKAAAREQDLIFIGGSSFTVAEVV